MSAKRLWVVLGVPAIAATVLILVLSGQTGASEPLGTTERVSVDSAGNQGNGPSKYPSGSRDGRYVSFHSDASNLVPGDTNGTWDVFVHDRQTGITERVSVDSDGGQGNSASYGAAISGDGRYVAFQSLASNLVPGDTNDTWDVFVHDRQTGATERVSVDSAGGQGNDDSYDAAISGDGRYVAFNSQASNLVPEDTNGWRDVFVHDRQTGATERVSAGRVGGYYGGYPALSADGRYVAFHSEWPNEVPGDTNGADDVFVHDRQTGATERVSVDSAGGQGNDDSAFPAISGDGRYVAFDSWASNLVAGDTNNYCWAGQNCSDIFVHDRQTGATQRVSVDSDGNEGNFWSVHLAISGDGRYVAFNSYASNLVPDDTNGSDDIFVHDRQTGITERVSVDSDGNQANAVFQREPDISGDGRYVAFDSDASNLVPGDTNGETDVFVRDRCPDGSCGGGPVPTPTPEPTPVPTPTPDTRPVVVLVHGYDGNKGYDTCEMDSLREYIKDPTKMGGHQFKTKCLRYKTRDGVRAGAKELEQTINRTGSDKVDIVAHSMGGLVARYYIEDEILAGRNKVRSLTMLGTPNWGTPIAIPPCTWALLPWTTDDQGACDLVPMSPLIRDLNLSPGSHSGVDYQVIIGWLGPRGLLAVPNDCIVEWASARGLSFSTELRPVLHVNPGGPQALIGCVGGTGYMDDPDTQARIADILLASNGLTSASSQSPAVTPTPPPEEPAPSTLAWRTGIIGAAEIVSLPVTMPGGQATATFVFRAPSSDGVTLSYSLLRPGGTPVSGSDADVSIEVGAGFGGLNEARYVVTTPAAGVWTMEVFGAAVPAGGWLYDLQALVPGGVSLTASVGAGHYDVGEPIALAADVAVDGTPVTSATVDATITKPDGTPASVALVGEGAGTYEGSFLDTSACGMYQVLVTATGSDGGTPFTREDRAIAVAGVPGNVILNPCNADSDGDGLTDEEEIETYSTNPAAADTDGDGCTDGEEVGPDPTLGGTRDPLDPWDFYDVPVPTLFSGGSMNNRDSAVTILNDVLGVLEYTGTSPTFPCNAGPDAIPGNGDDRCYTDDKDGDSVDDGVAYDRSPGPVWSEAPNGAITILEDVLLVLAQTPHSCQTPP